MNGMYVMIWIDFYDLDLIKCLDGIYILIAWVKTGMYSCLALA